MKRFYPSPFFLLCASSLALASCSLSFKESGVKAATHSVNASSGCLSQASATFDRFHQGNLSAEDHDAFYDCSKHALNTFLTYAVGKDPNSFTAAELSGFLSKYFLNGRAIPESFQTEAMALKAAILGGPTDHLTRDDLNATLAFLDRLQALSGKLRPLMPFSAARFLARGASGAEVESAIATFMTATEAFGAGQQGRQGSYDLTRLPTFGKELQSFLYPNGAAESHWTNQLLAFTHIAPAAKAIFLAPPRDTLLEADWARFYTLVPGYYTALVRAEFYLKAPFQLVEAGGLATADSLLQRLLDGFQLVLDQQPTRQISGVEIDELLAALEAQKMLPGAASAATTKSFVHALFGRVLGGAAGAGADFAITKDSLDRFALETRYLLEGAHGLEALFRPRFGDQFASGSLSVQEVEAASSDTLLAATHGRDALARQAVADLIATPAGVHTVFPGSESVVVIPARGLPESLSFSHLLRVHALRSLNRLLLADYGGPGATTVTLEEANAIGTDVFPFLIEAHFASPNVLPAVPKRFLEARLFLYASDGGPNVGMNEALEIETLLISTLVQGPTMHEKIAQDCNVKATSKKGAEEIPAACYRTAFTARMEETWSYLPGFVQFVHGLNPEQRLALFDTASFQHKTPTAGAASMARDPRAMRSSNPRATSAAVPPPDFFRVNDTEALLQLPYYVELLFSRFDQNGDGLLDNDEAKVAYPVFQPFLAQKANSLGYHSDDDYSAIYNFLLAFREIPTRDKWDYALHRYLLGDKNFRDNRSDVMVIFAKLLSF